MRDVKACGWLLLILGLAESGSLKPAGFVHLLAASITTSRCDASRTDLKMAR